MHQCLRGLAPSATDLYTNAKRDACVTGSLRVSAANPLRELLQFETPPTAVLTTKRSSQFLDKSPQ